MTRSVATAEVHALVFGFCNAFSVKETLKELLGKDVPSDGILDLHTLFDAIARNSAAE